MRNEDVFDLYKPLRNYISKLSVEDSLLAIHAHMQFQQFKQNLPAYVLGVPTEYQFAKKSTDFFNVHLFPWELAILAKEVIINGEKHGFRRSLLHWHNLSNAVNKLKTLEDNLTKLYLHEANVLLELQRIPHRQFIWQRAPDSATLSRYWKIYSHSQLRSIIKSCLGLSLDDIYVIGFSLIGFYLNKFALQYPPRIDIKSLDNRKLDVFLDHYSKDVEDLKDILKSEQEYNEKFPYAYSSLTSYPLVRMSFQNKDSLVCPIPRYLYNRFSYGLYYDICQQTGFDNAFGESFQEYVGIALTSLCKQAKIYPEAMYNKNTRTIDWILDDDTGALFIECKTKRLTFGAKAELLPEAALNVQLSKMAEFVVQTYKTLVEYLQGKYPHYKLDKNKRIYPLIVTLEDWFLFGDHALRVLDGKIREKFMKFKLSEELLEQYPYSVCSVQTLETLVQITSQVGINKVMEKKTKGELREWELLTYLEHNFKSELSMTKKLVLDEFKQFIDTYEH